MDATILGEVLGLPIPQGARLSVGVHGLDADQFEALVDAALSAGLPVAPKSSPGARWVHVEIPAVDLTLFAPADYSFHKRFDELIERKLAGTKFIEIPVPAPAPAAQIGGQR